MMGVRRKPRHWPSWTVYTARIIISMWKFRAFKHSITEEEKKRYKIRWFWWSIIFWWNNGVYRRSIVWKRCNITHVYCWYSFHPINPSCLVSVHIFVTRTTTLSPRTWRWCIRTCTACIMLR